MTEVKDFGNYSWREFSPLDPLKHLYLPSLRLIVNWWGLLWLECCWLLVLHLLSMDLTTWLSGVPLFSKDGGPVKIQHKITFRISVACWKVPGGCSRIVCSSALNLATDYVIFSLGVCLEFWKTNKAWVSSSNWSIAWVFQPFNKSPIIHSLAKFCN